MPTIPKTVTLDTHIYTLYTPHLSGGDVRKENETIRQITNIKFTQNLFHKVLLLINGSPKSKCSNEKFNILSCFFKNIHLENISDFWRKKLISLQHNFTMVRNKVRTKVNCGTNNPFTFFHRNRTPSNFKWTKRNRIFSVSLKKYF